MRLETLILPLTCCWPALLSPWPILELAGKEAKFEAMIYVLSVVTMLPNRNHSGVRHQWLALPGYDHKHKGRTLRSSQNAPYVAGKRLVLASPLEGQEARLRNPREETRGAVVLMQRGTCSFIEKVERALAAGAAGVIIGNNDKAHPHAVFAMPGAWESLIKPKSVYEGLSVMVSFACFEQLRALLRLEAEFSAAAPSGSVLRVDVVPLHGGVDSFGQNLQEWEIGSAIRFLTLRNDHEKLQDLIRYVDATFLSHDVPQCGEEGYGPYNETDPDTGNTPVHIAVEHDSIQCLGHLLQCRMIIHTVDRPRCDSFRPTHLAARRDHDLCLSLLLCAGAYVDAPHFMGWTPLHFAAQTGSINALRVLLRAHAAVNSRATDGSTPLLVAVLAGHAPAVEALLTAGADLYLRNHQGKLPIDFAGAGRDVTGDCLRVIERHQEEADSKSTLAQAFDNTPGEQDTHWSAAPWLSARSPMNPKPPFKRVVEGKSASPLPWESPSLEVLSFLPDRDHKANQRCKENSDFKRKTLPICRAVLPRNAVKALLCPLGDSNKFEEKADLQDDLAAFLAESSPPSDKNSHGSRVLSFITECVALATKSPNALPCLADRGRLVVVELPASHRKELWLALLSDGVKMQVEAKRIMPTHSEAVEGRIQCLYEDLRRTKFPDYAQGEGVERLRRLVLAWLHLDSHNSYRQGLTSLACIFLELFPSRRPHRWDNISDVQALQCMSQVVSQHLSGLFIHGNSMERLQDRMRLLESILLYWDPPLALHLAELEVVGELFCTPWLMTLFADVLPMESEVAVIDVLLTLGPSFCLCFAAAIVLQRRDLILSMTCQTSLLLAFSRLNAGVHAFDVPACLNHAFHLYAKTPSGIVQAWDKPHPQCLGDQSRQDKAELLHQKKQTSLQTSLSSLLWKKEAHGGRNSGRKSCMPAPHVLNHVPRLAAHDLRELAKAFKEREREQRRKDSQIYGFEKNAALRGCTVDGVVIIDVREVTMDEYYGRDPLRGVPDNIRCIRLPLSSVQGHVDFCRPLRRLQKDMQPPALLRPLVGRVHMVVHGGDNGGEQRADDVAHMLILCKVPLVSMFDHDASSISVASIA